MAKLGIRTRLRSKKLSTQLETIDVNLPKFGESLTENADGNAEPSSLVGEGVETRQEAPKN